MKTITIQIGNSDDKLTQMEWAKFVACCEDAIEARTSQVHFAGGSSNWCAWQNFAWVIMLDPERAAELRCDLEEIRKIYRQESVAWTEGETQFV